MLDQRLRELSKAVADDDLKHDGRAITKAQLRELIALDKWSDILREHGPAIIKYG